MIYTMITWPKWFIISHLHFIWWYIVIINVVTFTIIYSTNVSISTWSGNIIFSPLSLVSKPINCVNINIHDESFDIRFDAFLMVIVLFISCRCLFVFASGLAKRKQNRKSEKQKEKRKNEKEKTCLKISTKERWNYVHATNVACDWFAKLTKKYKIYRKNVVAKKKEKVRNQLELL